MSLGYIRIETADMDEDEAPYFYYLRGVDQGFVDHGGLPLYIWDERLANSSSDMWQAVIENPNIVLVDASFGLDAVGADGESLYPIQLSIGDSITLIDTSNPSNTRNVTVVGFLEQGSMWSTAGIFTGQDVAADQFHAELTRVYFSVDEDVTLEDRLELASSLEVAFLEQGLQVEVIEHQVQEFQRIVFSILDIFQAYLGLGLAVGIAGLGVVTVRSVSERSHQTGILRALGFQRGMVIGGYILELTWVSLMGIINGVIVGVGFHWYLYTKFWRERGEEFSMPWVSISLIVAGAYILVLLATAIPVRRAASIQPAEALRDIS
jgi:putative ABC transport system permease protein